MEVMGHLSEARPWCLQAAPGQEEEFCVAEDISQDAASHFAFQVNQGREAGHVWVEVVDQGYVPEIVTRLRVRCSH